MYLTPRRVRREVIKIQKNEKNADIDSDMREYWLKRIKIRIGAAQGVKLPEKMLIWHND